jgi:nucleoside-diphosphate-sugar epimerase
MEGISELYHCAGLVSFDPSDISQLYKINVEGTANVVNAALDAGISKMVHVSSVAALGRIRKHELITEKMQWTKETSNSTYGHSKYLGEMEVWRGIAEGMDAVIVNPVIILGPGDWNEGSTKLFKSVYEGFPWFTQGTTGFVDVEDVAKSMRMLMKSTVTAEKFILSEGDHSYEEVLRLIAEAFNKPAPSKKVTPVLSKLVWRIESLRSLFTGKKPLITRETSLTAMAEVHFDNSKLLKALPDFNYTPLEETIRNTARALTVRT